ncbi:MAG: glycosyltransferase family 2 protein [Lachnospiraceae bacterium]|nr:glycosyltransferase family 2 protein [Lachnospiraceae bacterium]
MQLGVVICNYNKKDKLLECIKAVSEQKFSDFDLYICDNASSDGSAGTVIREYSLNEYDGNVPEKRFYRGRLGDESEIGLELIVNAENLGGSGGFNTGLKAAYKKGYDFLMCVDNDAFLDENCIQKLIDFLIEHEEAGIAAAKIYHYERPDTVQNYGQIINFESFCTEVPDLGRTEDGTMPKFVYSDAVPACALIIRKEVVDQIGFMPEENFLYWDDTEWCTRAREAGWKVASVGDAKALHCMGAKKEDVNTFPTYYAWRNWIRYFILHTPEEKLPNMAITFLTSVYLVQYEGYKGERFQKAATVMAAYEDAVNNVMGKAKDGIIGEIEKDGQNICCDSIKDLPEEFEKGREMFVFAHLPGFLRKARAIRNEYQKMTL